MSQVVGTTSSVKVFVSSLIGGYEAFRGSVVDAATMLGHTVLRAEDLGATPSSPQQACLSLVRESDVVVLLLGERYGTVQPSGLSATHEEYREARERKPVLVFVEDVATRDDPQARFLEEVQEWATGHFRASFQDPASLQAAVVRGLHDLELAISHGAFDEAECLGRARSILPRDARGLGSGPELVVATAAGPHQQVVRPAELGDQRLAAELQQEALFGAHPVLDRTAGTREHVQGSQLLLQQDHGEVMLDQAGSVRVSTTLRYSSGRRGAEITSIIQEDVQQFIGGALRYSGWVLDRVDPVRRLTDVVVLVYLGGAGWMPWRTRSEHNTSPSTATMGMGGDVPSVVALTPPRRHRQALSHDADRMAEDLTVLLARDRRQ
jgi:hypothetical protein